MYLHKWRLAMHEAEQNLVKHVNDSLAMILTRGSQVQEHLACFVPGMLMLGYGTLEREVPQSERERWRVLAQKLAMFCSESYAKSFTGLGAEAVDEFHRAVDDRNALRPEVAESIYYMKFFTGDEQWRARSWQIVLSLNKWSKRKYGYTSLKNISTSPSSDNKQESFFFAELLKYLYLAHTTPEEFDPTRMILTTEAHPLNTSCARRESNLIPSQSNSCGTIAFGVSNSMSQSLVGDDEPSATNVCIGSQPVPGHYPDNMDLCR